MRVVISLMIKEFRQIRRERVMLRVIFIMPVMMILVLGSALTTDINHLATAIADLDQSPLSRSITESFVRSDLFDVLVYPENPDAVESSLQKGAASVGIIIPQGFSRRLYRNESPSIAIWIDGIDSNAGLIAGGYAANLLLKTSRDLLKNTLAAQSLPLEPRFKILYNPELESRLYTIPGIVAVIILMVTSILSSMSIVREREIGTLEQLMVTPIRSVELLLGKLLPFMILGFFELLVTLLLGKLIFNIPFVGSIITLLCISVIFLLTSMGTGLFVSTITSTQQQAMFFTWFFNLFALLMSGFLFPIANMPVLLQRLTLVNPLRYFVTIIREIVLKGASWIDLWQQIAAMFALGSILFLIAAIRFNKRVS